MNFRSKYQSKYNVMDDFKEPGKFYPSYKPAKRRDYSKHKNYITRISKELAFKRGF